MINACTDQRQSAITVIKYGSTLGGGNTPASLAGTPQYLCDHGLLEVLGDAGWQIPKRIAISCPQPSGKRVNGIMNLDELVTISHQVALLVEECRKRQEFILALGGGQEIDFGVLSGIAAACDGELGAGAADGHLDYNTNETTITGHPHGMTLSSLTGRGHPRLVNIHRPGRKIPPGNVVIGCVNSHTPDFFQSDDREMTAAIAAGIRFHTMQVFKGVHQRDLRYFFDELDEVRSRVQAFVALIDMDVVDRKYAPGVAMPNPDGWHPDELFRFAEHLQENRCRGAPLVGATLVEIDPAKDREGLTATLGIETIRRLLGKR